MSGNGKKGLWLVLAISIFVLIVLGAAFFLFAPSRSAQATPFDIKGKAEPKPENPSDYLAGQPGMTSEAPATQTTSTNSSGDIIILYGDQSGSQPATPTTRTSTPSSSTQSPAIVSPPTTATTVQPAAKPAAKPATTTTTVAKPKTTTSQAVKPASGNYWIQAGSFRTKSGADSLLSEFQKKNISATISIRDIDGKSYYQVRVGPYTSREDAKKWLSTAKSVPGASAEAFITQ
ncbi:MAG: SPOR domain-containing protein [Spirochaetaceae bacterium]|nr:SPOR domain-containing protein [Spirochaetaceae bacterium]